MAQVLWVIAVLSNIAVMQRMLFTWQETRRKEREEEQEKFAPVPLTVPHR
jgi:hypothetical protein